MDNSMYDNVELASRIFRRSESKIPKIDSNTNYWFVRAQGGILYNSFLVGNYIAIGWNSITLEDLVDLTEDEIKSKIKEYHTDVEKPGSPYNQMMRFAFNINVGDIVIVPSEAPNNLAVGIVNSRPYTETDEQIQSETNVCPYNKRIKVSWMGVIRNEDIDPQLYKLVYSGHTISAADQYKNYINRGLFSAYVDGNMMSITFKVKEDGGINAFQFNYFISKVLAIAEILSDDDNHQIDIRTNVQSPGPIELLGNPQIMSGVSMILSWVFKFSVLGFGAWGLSKLFRTGGSITYDHTTNKFEAKINGEALNDKVNAEADAIRTDSHIKKTQAAFEIAKDPQFIEAARALNIEVPSEVVRAINETVKEMAEELDN